jgi:hypothetical protein
VTTRPSRPTSMVLGRCLFSTACSCVAKPSLINLGSRISNGHKACWAHSFVGSANSPSYRCGNSPKWWEYRTLSLPDRTRLRAPSESALESIAVTLDISADELCRMAGFVERPRSVDEGTADLEAAIEAAKEVTSPQRRAMLEIYRSFLDANVVRRTRNE